MTPAEALAILAESSGAHRGTRADHDRIRQAVDTVAKMIALHQEIIADQPPAQEPDHARQ